MGLGDPSPRRFGWHRNVSSGELEIYYNGTLIGFVNGSLLSVIGLTVTGNAGSLTLPAGSVIAAALAAGAVGTTALASGAVLEAILDPAVNLTLNAKRNAHFHATFAGQGGDYDAVGGIPFAGNPLPNHAIVQGGTMKVNTIPVGPTNALVSFLSAGDAGLVASAAISGAPWSTTGVKAIIPITAATAIETVDALRVPLLSGTVADFTAYDIEIWLDYYVATA